MTRCYEFYCAILINPTFCEDKSDRTVAYIQKYIKFMQDQNVKFDKTVEDKELFMKYQDEFGSEKVVTQPIDMSKTEQLQQVAVVSENIPQVHQISESIPQVCQLATKERPLVECSRCHLGRRDTVEYKGEILCPSCLENAGYKPERKPVEPATVTASIIKPQDTWEQRKARMQTPISKMEEAVLVKLEQKGLHPDAQREFCLRSTRPDYYFPQQNLAVYLDGEVHRGREDRDEALRELLSKRYGVRVVTILYEGSSEATEDSIVEKIVEATLHI